MTIRIALITLSFLCGLSPFLICEAGLQVGGITVNVKSDTGLKARELALCEARRKAFLEITQGNSAFEYDLKAQGMPTDTALEDAVDTFEIEKEKISPKQYIGTLSITFSEKGLRRLLKGHYERDETDEASKETGATTGGAKENTNDKDVILVPVYLTSDESLMWHTNNPWHQFWQQAPQDEALKALIPLGDVQDIMSVSIEDIMTNRARSIQGLLDRYGKSALVVAILQRVSLEHNELELTVKLFHSNRLIFSSEPIFIEAPTAEEGFSKARTALINALQDQSTSAPQTKNIGLQTYRVTASFNSFAQWQQIRRGAKKIGALQVFSVASLSRTFAKVVIKSSLPFQELVGELARHGLVLSEGAPGSFDLHVGLTQLPPSRPLSLTDSPLPSTALKGPKIRSAFEVSP